MKILTYNDLDYAKVRPAFERTLQHLEGGDFRAADVRKMSTGPYYRAKLNAADRLIFRYGRCDGETCLLLLEVVYAHAYEKSRFLGGALVDEAKLTPWTRDEPAAPEEVLHLPFVNPAHARFHLLDKPLSFDDHQDAALRRQPPLIIIGSAGSGKTALTVEKLKQLSGRALYVTLSPYLAENARDLYFAHRYDNPQVEIDFLSFDELLQSIKVPAGREVAFRDFAAWYGRFRAAGQTLDAHPLFEEFRGVLTGWRTDVPYLSREDYLDLGVRQSIFLGSQRPAVYTLFEKYRAWLEEAELRDANMTAFEWLPLAQPTYDFVVIDEVQDLTNVQVQFALALLKQRLRFILCGDANQIVHPNFFSWAHIKTLFHERQAASGGKVDIAQILDANYRNTPEVTDLANRLLLIKNARFGSVDRESNYLIRSMQAQPGKVDLIAHKDKHLRDLDAKTRRSTRFAVIALRDEDKAEARKHFSTPLVFSIQEAKGLEYENIILYNVVSAYHEEFSEIIDGVDAGALEKRELAYARARDKTDKSLDAYKFYINALYVAVTRAMRNLYLVEARTNHRLHELLGLREAAGAARVTEQASSTDEWAREARRLEKQGKREQADLIRGNLLGHQPVPWQVITPETTPDLLREALDPDHFNKKAKQLLYEHSLINGRLQYLQRLAQLKFTKAEIADKHSLEEAQRKYHKDVNEKSLTVLKRNMHLYGVDYRDPLNHTPLMLATQSGNGELVRQLLESGANPDLSDSWGRTPFHICLWYSVYKPNYSQLYLADLYEALLPSHLNVRVDEKLVKLDAHTAEFFILNYMIATFQFQILHKFAYYAGFETADFVYPMEDFPPAVVPYYRRRRSYLSSVLARNEVNRDAPYNRRLFVRIERGHYLPNPAIEVQTGDTWKPIYECIGLDDLDDAGNAPMVTMLRNWVRTSRETGEIPIWSRF